MSETGAKLIDVPSLDSLAANPGLIQGLPGPVVHNFLVQVTCLLPLLVAKAHAADMPEHTTGDRLLDIDEAAAMLGKSKDALYRHSHKFPFTIRDGRSLRFSQNGIQKYIRARLQQG